MIINIIYKLKKPEKLAIADARGVKIEAVVIFLGVGVERMIVFILTMPNVGSWNGEWTGRGNLYCKTRKLDRAKEAELDNKSFYYNFGDGWGASVKTKKVEAKEAKKMRKASKGFCGYEWMIDSILEHNKIIT